MGLFLENINGKISKSSLALKEKKSLVNMDDKTVKVFAPQNIWDDYFTDYYDNFKSLLDYEDGISKLIYQYIPNVKGHSEKSFFEIGCYLARYMYHFGKLDYTLNGIDQCQDMDKKFTDYLKNEGFKVGNITIEDVFKLKTEKQYDVVASFGFIEHFSNFLELIELHFKLVKKGGYAMITIPNLASPVQYAFHKLFDQDHLAIHNLKALKPDAWKEVVNKDEYDIVFDGYAGELKFWVADQKRNFFQKAFLKIFFSKLVRRMVNSVKTNSKYYSPYYCLIVKRK